MYKLIFFAYVTPCSLL